jgi:nucleoside-diphosphate-sugar epimerase
MQRLVVTGATGALAPFLIHELLHEDPGSFEFVCIGRRVAGLARERVRARIEAICPACARRVVAPRFRFIQGDLRDPIRYGGSADAVWHFAADIRWQPEAADAVFAANVGGTKHILDLCERSGATLYHVSTAYTCGRRTGTVLEDELLCGQDFRNAYEASKAQAEQDVRTWLRDHPGMVFRPSIVMGDTRTGLALAFHGLYMPVSVLWKLREAARDRLGSPDGPIELPLEVPCYTGESRINVVGADYVTSLAIELSRKPESLGRTFHLTHPNPPTMKTMIESCTSVLDMRGVRLVDKGASALDALTEMARGFDDSILDLFMTNLPYLADLHPHFDMRNVKEVCGSVPAHTPLDRDAWERIYRFAIERRFRSIE